MILQFTFFGPDRSWQIRAYDEEMAWRRLKTLTGHTRETARLTNQEEIHP